MVKPITNLKPPVRFEFPFVPYDIQHDFMTELYEVIENERIGIFESPTGTGKSLTLLTGALTWLYDHENRIRIDLQHKILKTQKDIDQDEKSCIDSLNWIDDQYALIKKREELLELKVNLETIENYNKKIEKLKTQQLEIKEKIKWNNKMKLKEKSDELNGAANESYNDEIFPPADNEDEQFLINDEINLDETEILDDETEHKYQGTTVFFCSRTHSQLTQIVKEVKNTVFNKSIRCISLASRQNYCVNDNVRKLKSNSLINEECLELQTKSVKKQSKHDDDVNSNKSKRRKCENGKENCETTGKCNFYKSNLIENLQNQLLFNVYDIEELVNESKIEKACPYYATRLASKDAQLVLLPYQMLLHRKTRQQIGLNVKNSVIIIDEAHNLCDTIANIHSAELFLGQLEKSHEQLKNYRDKYLGLFSTKNLLLLNQLIFINYRLIKLLSDSSNTTTTSSATLESNIVKSKIMLVHELITEGEFCSINIYEILKFCERNKFAQKLQGFTKYYAGGMIKNDLTDTQKANDGHNSGVKSYLKLLTEQQTLMVDDKQSQNSVNVTIFEEDINTTQSSQHSSVIRYVLNFLECLLDRSSVARILITYNPIKSKSTIKYFLLNASEHINEILNQCRSLIVAGGTMQPTFEFTDQLFISHKNKISEHFYGHVVDKKAVLPIAIHRGPSNTNFLFNFLNRNNKQMLSQLSMTLLNVCNVVPAGIVCFFASYDFMETFYRYLNECGILGKLEIKKKVFKEPRNNTKIEDILSEFSLAAKGKYLNDKQNGAFLMSVIGGKLSEGLNFSDELGRCVIVVGLPFPNKNDPELSAKMKYLNETVHNTAGAEYYENLCMKAVNQCIGRAIRHINDYAAVLLIDERYHEAKIIKKLPTWIRQSLIRSINYGMVQGNLAKFFRDRR